MKLLRSSDHLRLDARALALAGATYETTVGGVTVTLRGRLVADPVLRSSRFLRPEAAGRWWCHACARWVGAETPCAHLEHSDRIRGARAGMEPRGGRRLLSAEAVRAIRAEPGSRGSNLTLAARYGVSPWTINRVRAGRSYRDAAP